MLRPTRAHSLAGLLEAAFLPAAFDVAIVVTSGTGMSTAFALGEETIAELFGYNACLPT